MTLHDQLINASLRRCLTIAEVDSDQLAFTHDINQGPVYQADTPAAAKQLLQSADALGTTARYFFGSDRLRIGRSGRRPLEIEIEEASDPTLMADSLNARLELAKISLLYARCRVALQWTDKAIAVLDQDLVYLDSNGLFGRAASELIGCRCGEASPIDWLILELAPVAFADPGLTISQEFEFESLPGIACRYRAELIAYGEELLIAVSNLTPYPWLSKH